MVAKRLELPLRTLSIAMHTLIGMVYNPLASRSLPAIPKASQHLFQGILPATYLGHLVHIAFQQMIKDCRESIKVIASVISKS